MPVESTGSSPVGSPAASPSASFEAESAHSAENPEATSLSEQKNISPSNVRLTTGNDMPRTAVNGGSPKEAKAPHVTLTPEQIERTEERNPPKEPSSVIPPHDPKQPSLSSLGSSDDSTVQTTRVLTAEQFKQMFHGDTSAIASASASQWGPARAQNASSAPPRSQRRPQSAPRKPTQVDPYAGTRYGAMMARPIGPSKAARKLHRSVKGSSVPSPVRTASPRPSSPVSGTAFAERSSTEQQNTMRLMEQVMQMRLQLQLKDQHIHQLMRQKGQLEQDNAHLAAVKFSRHGTQGEVQPADEVIIHLKSRISFLEERLRLSEEEVQTARHTSKSLRIATLHEQSETYLAEVHRLRTILRDIERRERAGLDSAALAEAKSLLSSKETALLVLQEKYRALKHDHRTILMERDALKNDTEHHQRTLQQVREAPAEVLRLQMELRLAEERLSDARQELSRLTGDRDALHRTSQSREETIHSVFKDRDAMRADIEHLRMQLRAHESSTEMKVAKAVEEARKESEQKLREAMLFAQDREAALKADARDAKQRCEELEAQVARLVVEHKDEVETMKAKEQQRHENMLRTIGAYDRGVQSSPSKALKDAEQRLASEREQLEKEKAQFQAEIAKQLAREEAPRHDPNAERELRKRLEDEWQQQMNAARANLDEEYKARLVAAEADMRKKLENEAHVQVRLEVDRQVREQSTAAEKDIRTRLEEEYKKRESVLEAEMERRFQLRCEERDRAEKNVSHPTDGNTGSREEVEPQSTRDTVILHSTISDPEPSQPYDVNEAVPVIADDAANDERKEGSSFHTEKEHPPPQQQHEELLAEERADVGRYASAPPGVESKQAERQSIDSAVLGTSNTPREATTTSNPPPPSAVTSTQVVNDSQRKFDLPRPPVAPPPTDVMRRASHPSTEDEDFTVSDSPNETNDDTTSFTAAAAPNKAPPPAVAVVDEPKATVSPEAAHPPGTVVTPQIKQAAVNDDDDVSSETEDDDDFSVNSD